YTPVREWARSASLAAEYPAIAQAPGPAPAAPRAEGILAMQTALVTWLAALGRMADDGVQPYPEDPFRDLAPAAARLDPQAGAAIAELGRILRRATRQNLRAPALRGTIREGDAAVQSLIAALGRAVADAAPAGPGGGAADSLGGRYALLLREIAAAHAMLKAEARDITDPATVQRIRAAEDQVRRASRSLPLPARPLPADPVPADPPLGPRPS
ncbi:MAG: hypothetical protein AAGC69_20080, partial [Paracraurococcus sp.]